MIKQILFTTTLLSTPIYALDLNINSDGTIGIEHTQGKGVIGATINEDKLLFTVGFRQKFKYVDVVPLIELGRHDIKREYTSSKVVTTTKQVCTKFFKAGPKKGQCKPNAMKNETTSSTVTSNNTQKSKKVSSGLILRVEKPSGDFTPYVDFKTVTKNGGLSSEESVNVGLKFSF